ncbi:hypothetical protein [Stenotrophomonas tuberculopleuritidis]|uniref:hypothetical protein n=1 Tax=Stenotrophomonas tuberculopleuritidis TaxID=3055079 RepID=UPI0026E571B1|nr:hypothetical protein [Stenotrophomonas sp. 704A1]
MSDRRQRLVYAALAVLPGAPSVLFGGAMAVIGMAGSVLSLADGTVALPGQALMLVWGIAGLAGCLAWLDLSGGYLFAGRSALRVRSRAQWHALLLAGPSLLVPAGMLCWLRPRP